MASVSRLESMVQVIVAVFVVGLILTPFADDDDADEVVQQGATMIEGHSTTTAAITARVTTRPTEASGKFDQTWEKKYDETSCTEWRADMTENERRMAAADMLTGGRSVDGTNELPSDRVIADFQRNVSTACEADDRRHGDRGIPHRQCALAGVDADRDAKKGARAGPSFSLVVGSKN